MALITALKVIIRSTIAQHGEATLADLYDAVERMFADTVTDDQMNDAIIELIRASEIRRSTIGIFTPNPRFCLTCRNWDDHCTCPTGSNKPRR